MGPSWCCRVQPEAKQVITGDYEYLKKPVVGCSAHRAFVKGVHQLVEWDSLLYGVCQATIEKPYRRPLRANVCREYHGPYIHIEYHICSASFQNTLLGVARDGKKMLSPIFPVAVTFCLLFSCVIYLRRYSYNQFIPLCKNLYFTPCSV